MVEKRTPFVAIEGFFASLLGLKDAPTNTSSNIAGPMRSTFEDAD